MIARMSGQPSLDPRVLVSGVVVDDQMNVQLSRHILLHLLEKGEILLMAMAAFTRSKDATGGDIQGGKQRGGSVTDIIMGHAFDVV